MANRKERSQLRKITKQSLEDPACRELNAVVEDLSSRLDYLEGRKGPIVLQDKIIAPEFVNDNQDIPRDPNAILNLGVARKLFPTETAKSSTSTDASSLLTSPFVTPLDYGATGDGVVDDTSYCQNAIDGETALCIPAGYTFLVSGLSIVDKDDFRLYGQGIFKLKDASDDNILEVDSSLRVNIDGIEFDGNKAGQTTASASGVILVKNSGFSVVNNCYIHDGKFAGVVIENNGGSTEADECSVTNCNVSSNDGHGIHIYPTGDPLVGPGLCYISGNSISENGGCGVYSQDGDKQSIANNSVTGNALDGVQVASCDGVEITGNLIYDNDHHGVVLSTCDHGSISNNEVHLNSRGTGSYNGIDIDTCTYLLIDSNYSGDYDGTVKQDYGLELSGPSTDLRITNNNFDPDNNELGAVNVLDSSTYTSYNNNGLADHAGTPDVVSSVVATISDDTNAYKVNISWAAAADTSNLSYYRRELTFYNDTSLTAMDSDGAIFLGPSDRSATSDDAGPFPKREIEQYIVPQIRAVNIFGEMSDPVTGAARTITALGTAAEPPNVTTTGESVIGSRRYGFSGTLVFPCEDLAYRALRQMNMHVYGPLTTLGAATAYTRNQPATVYEAPNETVATTVTWATDQWDRPTEDEYFKILYYKEATGGSIFTNSAAASALLTVSAVGAAPAVTTFTVSEMYRDTTQDTANFDWLVTLPKSGSDIDPMWDGGVVEIEAPDGSGIYEIATGKQFPTDAYAGADTLSGEWVISDTIRINNADLPTSTATWEFRFRSINVADPPVMNARGTNEPTPVTITGVAQGTPGFPDAPEPPDLTVSSEAVSGTETYGFSGVMVFPCGDANYEYLRKARISIYGPLDSGGSVTADTRHQPAVEEGAPDDTVATTVTWSTRTDEWTRPSSTEYYKIRYEKVGVGGKEYDNDPYESSLLTVSPTADAPACTDFTVSAMYRDSTQDTGNFDWSFKCPKSGGRIDPAWGGSGIWIEAPSGSASYQIATQTFRGEDSEPSGSDFLISDTIRINNSDLPTETATWSFRCRSVNNAAEVNAVGTNEPTPIHVGDIIQGTAGLPDLGDAPNLSTLSSATVYYDTVCGAPTYGFRWSAVMPADATGLQTVELYAVDPAATTIVHGPITGIIGPFSNDETIVGQTGDTWLRPSAAETWAMEFRCFNSYHEQAADPTTVTLTVAAAGDEIALSIPSAPNIDPITYAENTLIGCQADYLETDEEILWRFKGAVAFNTAHTDYEHTDYIRIKSISQYSADTERPACDVRAPAATGGTVTVTFATDYYPLVTADETWYLRFYAINTAGESSDSPPEATLTAKGQPAPTTVVAGDSGNRRYDTINNVGYTTITALATHASGSKAKYQTAWYYDGGNWTWINAYPVPSTISFERNLGTTTSTGCKVAIATGVVYDNEPTTNAAQSAVFNVAGYTNPASTLVSGASVGTITYARSESGVVSLWGGTITLTNPGSGPSFWTTRVTRQLVDSSGNATSTWEGEETEVFSNTTPGAAVSHTFEGWRLPASTDTYRNFRLRVYTVSRNGVETLQACWPSGATYYDVVPTAQSLGLAEPNLIPNGDFSLGDLYWNIKETGGAGVQSTGGVGGGPCLKLAPDNTGGWPLQLASTYRPKVKAGQTLAVECYLKKDAGVSSGGIEVYCFFYNPGGTGYAGGLVISTSHTAISSSSWTKVTGTVEIPSATEGGVVGDPIDNVEFLVACEATGGNFYIDAMSANHQSTSIYIADSAVTAAKVATTALGRGLTHTGTEIVNASTSEMCALYNHSFDDASGSDITHWTVSGTAEARTDTPYSGSKHVRLSLGTTISQYCKVRPSERWKVDAWIRPLGSNNYAQIRVTFWDSTLTHQIDIPTVATYYGDSLGGYGYYPLVSAWVWNQMSCTITVPANEVSYNVDSMKVEIRIVDIGLGGDAHSWDLDHVWVQSAPAALDLSKAIAATFASAEFEVTGGQLKVKGVDLSKSIVGSYSGSEFEVSAGALVMKELSATKIKTGTLSVGGGTGKPGKMAVFDSAGLAVGWIGDDSGSSGYSGAWFKRILIGGATPSAAQAFCDINGNLTVQAVCVSGTVASAAVLTGTVTANQVQAGAFTGCTLVLNTSGVTTSISNGNIAGFITGLSVANNSNSLKSMTAAGLYGLMNSTGQIVAQFDSWSGYGHIELRTTASVRTVNISGENGHVECNSVYSVGAIQTGDRFRAPGGYGASPTISYFKSGGGVGTLVFSGGILVSSI